MVVLIAQVWRGGTGRQARLAQALQAVEIVPLDEQLGGGLVCRVELAQAVPTDSALDEQLGRRAGVLLARSGSTDAIDAALAAMADHGDQIITSDPTDLTELVRASTRRVDVVRT